MEPPIRPDESECCNSDCNPCILEVYEEQLKKYLTLKSSHVDQNMNYTNCVSKTTYSVFKVTHIEHHAEDAVLLSFEYIRPAKASCDHSADPCRLFYEAGQYFLLKAGPKNDEFTRAYTPIPSERNGTRSFTVLIKLYEDGRMSRYIRRWKELKQTEWRGPYGDYTINYGHKYILFIAQGSGIAPIYSVICKLLDNEDCSSFVKLFYCCRSPRHIYLRDQLYELQRNWNFSYDLFLSNSEELSQKYNETVHGSRLGITDINSYLEGKIDALQVVICGSENFEAVIKDYVSKCDVAKEKIYLF